jgi:polysaccharide deacetylase family protein (PEP-CTERM system associated)
MRNALTIDVEEHFQVHNLEAAVERSSWDRQESRVEANVWRVLELLDRHRVKATFFVLGWVAERRPRLVGEIASRGHEVASHGYEHRLVYTQTREEFAEDLRRSLGVLGQALAAVPGLDGGTICGYRAPSFSITRAVPWAQDVILEAGLRYDSSIMPATGHPRYGIGDAPRFAHVLSNGLVEFPMATVRSGGRNWPVAGGGYFRLLPLAFTRWALRRLNRQGHPAVVYLHPWEFDPEQPRFRGPSAWLRFRHYVNLDRTAPRLERLLQEFSFAPLREVFGDLLRRVHD